MYLDFSARRKNLQQSETKDIIKLAMSGTPSAVMLPRCWCFSCQFCGLRRIFLVSLHSQHASQTKRLGSVVSVRVWLGVSVGYIESRYGEAS